MSRSFQIVEYKVAESDFFLDKIIESSYDLNVNIHEASYYLSAFLSATRSITFCIQASISDIPNFDNWYSKQQEILKSNSIAKYFLNARNHSQKVGFYPIDLNRLSISKDKSGRKKFDFYFAQFSFRDDLFVPKNDVIHACKEYFKLLLTIVFECYNNFGMLIDPDQYYTIENMKRLNRTIEDFEEELGFPRGWTAGDSSSDEDRMSCFRKQNHTNGVDEILVKYLGKDRFNNVYL